MSEYGDILKSLVVRVVLAVVFIAAGFFALTRAAGGDMVWGFGLGLFGCAGLLAGAIIIAFPLARLIAEPSGNLFWPDKHYDRPQPMYSIPESKRAKGLYEEAIAGFEKIAKDCPGELKPYIEMIDIAIMNLKDPERAKTICERGVSLLKKKEDKNALIGMYEAISTRLSSKPAWNPAADGVDQK